ncbi:MAG: SRPBCC family protein [Mobilitalea sp.]
MNYSNREIRKTKVINQSVNDLWTKWTTHDGLISFFGKDNKIELKIGGAFEIYFLLKNPVGLQGSEGCKILSFLPNRMLSFSWNVPPKFKELRESDHKTWVVIEFKEINVQKTEILLIHLGWIDCIQWNEVFEYFNEAWESVLNHLEESFVTVYEKQQGLKTEG